MRENTRSRWYGHVERSKKTDETVKKIRSRWKSEGNEQAGEKVDRSYYGEI